MAAQIDSSTTSIARDAAPRVRIQGDVGHAWFLLMDRDQSNAWRGLDMHFAAGWYLTPRVAVGAAYDHFGRRVTTRFDFDEPIDNQGNRSVDVSESVSLDFVGPTLLFKNHLNRRFYVSGGLAFGYLRFETPTQLYMQTAKGFVVKPAVSSGGTFGLIPQAGIEFALTREISVGIGARFVYGSISQLEVVPDSGATARVGGDDFSRVSVGGGLRVDL